MDEWLKVHICAGTAAAMIAVAALTGCSASKPPDVETVWLRADGSPASEKEIADARRHCEREVESGVQVSSKRRDSMQWGTRMVECMEAGGHYLVQRKRGSD
jgi:hypothetical protein